MSTRSQAYGAPFSILNDQLRVRDYSKLPDSPATMLATPSSAEVSYKAIDINLAIFV
jgi:hypothetical protein